MNYSNFSTLQHHDIESILNKYPLKNPPIAVYCGAKPGKNPIYEKAAIELGEKLSLAGFNLVYGGASVGLMGVVATEMLKNNSQVVGVIPATMFQHETPRTDLTYLHVTDSMHTRKSIIEKYAYGFVTLPGGIGTVEEIMEIMTWGRLFNHGKPMIILNINHFFDDLKNQLLKIVSEGFMDQKFLNNILFTDSVEECVATLKQKVNF